MLTIPLAPGSPAIGAGSNALIPSGISTDQRGLPRQLAGKRRGGHLARYEYRPFVTSISPATGSSEVAPG